MQFLRSNQLFHLDCNLKSLTLQERSQGRVTARPTLQGFNQHSDQICEEFVSRHYRSSAISVMPWNPYRIVCENGEEVYGNQVFLCLGNNQHSTNPRHIFCPDFTPPDVTRQIAVIGGGISAAHLLIKYQAMTQHQILWYCRSRVRMSKFDAAPKWASKNEIASFQTLPLVERQRILSTNRFDGSIPPDLMASLESLSSRGKIREVASLENFPEEQRIYATGFDRRASHPLLTELANRYVLPMDNEGRPDITPSLEWLSNLFVLGQFGELMLGPLGRNIAGAKLGCCFLPPPGGGEQPCPESFSLDI